MTQTKEKKREYYLRNREKILARQKERRAQNPELLSRKNRQYHNGPVERIWGRPRPTACEICGGDNSGRIMRADHDHATGAPRLFLCQTCNTLEGHIKTQWPRLTMLLAYHLWLEGYRGRLNAPVEIRDFYPACPTPSTEDIAWIRRVLERGRKRK